ncbi:MAG: hypothetical protein ABWY11_21870, partial [Umezawaea sp.]
MLGTGIASAQENVNPDAAPPAIDGGITVPIDMEKKAIGQPAGGQRELPEFHREAGANQFSGTNPLVRDPSAPVDTSSATTNAVRPQLAGPAPVDGNAIAAAANSSATSSTADNAEAGSTTGEGAPLVGDLTDASAALPVSGTIAQGPATAPADAYDLAADVAGAPTGQGDHGTVSSNVVTAPVAAGAQAFSDAAALVGTPTTDTAPAATPEATALEVLGDAVDAGGNVESDAVTTDDLDSLSGDTVAAQVAAPVQDLADAASAQAASVADTLVTVPVNAAPTVHGEPVTAGGITKTASGTRFGKPITTGNGSALVPVPVATEGRVHDIPAEVLDAATAFAQTSTTQAAGEEADGARAVEAHRGIDLPASVDKLLGASEIPNLANLTRLPAGTEALNTLPSSDLLGAVDLPTQGLNMPINALPLPTDGQDVPEERSFGGTLPVTGSNFGLTPSLQGPRPLAPTGRSLPTAPVTPTLPVVVPIAPITQARTLPTPAFPAPALPTTSVTG